MSSIIKVDQPSYKIMKWIGSGGFGQVFKVHRNGRIVVCKQIESLDMESALGEHENMSLLRDVPGIARVHDGLEWNRKTKKLSIFMDYYEGRDLEQQILVLQASGSMFSEYQILGLGFQIAQTLAYCHEQNILHQDIKPMNVLLERTWDPITDPTVPDVYVADFGIASQVQTVATRYTQQRGTPSYQAPEIKGQFALAAFSEKSDVYALGCILFRLCTFEDPILATGLSINDLESKYGLTYSPELLMAISAMLSRERDDRPIAAEIKVSLGKLLQRFDTRKDFPTCRTCGIEFASRTKLRRHIKDAGHSLSQRATNHDELHKHPMIHPHDSNTEHGYKKMSDIMEALDRSYGYFDCADIQASMPVKDDDMLQEPINPSPCVVCMKYFNSKKGFFQHLHCGHHWRNQNYVAKRRFEDAADFEGSKRQKIDSCP